MLRAGEERRARKGGCTVEKDMFPGTTFCVFNSLASPFAYDKISRWIDSAEMLSHVSYFWLFITSFVCV